MAKTKDQGRQKKQKKVEKESSPEVEEKKMAEKRSKRVEVDSSDSDSGPDDVKAPPAKVAKSGASKLKSSEGNTYFELDRNKRVTIREFKNKVYVDIREFYEKDGDILPGKKGISMNVTQWNKLKTLISDIDDEVQQLA